MGTLDNLYLHSMVHPDVADAYVTDKEVPKTILQNEVPDTSVIAGMYIEPSTDPDWQETDRELTSSECVLEDGKKTGMATKTYTVTYTDVNEHSATYNTTKEETETETVEDLENCAPEPSTDPDWQETNRELTSSECVLEGGKKTGMATKTYTVTYTDVNEYSATYNTTKEENETETVEDLENCAPDEEVGTQD